MKMPSYSGLRPNLLGINHTLVSQAFIWSTRISAAHSSRLDKNRAMSEATFYYLQDLWYSSYKFLSVLLVLVEHVHLMFGFCFAERIYVNDIEKVVLVTGVIDSRACAP